MAVAVTPLGRYLARAAWEEARILARRQPIEELVADPATPPELRGKLQLVLAAREFATDSLGLSAGESFTQFTQLDSDTLVMVLSAAYRDRLAYRTWWFPIVGRVPYKGFFSLSDALAAERQMDEAGLDTYLRPASAFSTLGWFNDPLVSSTLRADSLRLVDTVIHEILHSTFYASGQAVFNESFANFVGARGSQRFFEARSDTAAVRRIEDRWHDQKQFGEFWTAVASAVDAAYANHPSDSAARVAARDSAFRRMRVELEVTVGPQLRAIDRNFLPQVRIDNARLMAQRIYLTELQLFDLAWYLEGRDLRRTIDRVIGLARSRPRDPYGAVRDWVDAQLVPMLPASGGWLPAGTH